MSVLIGILNSVIVLLSLFLICIILIQRGKGGGLAGAFGGVGGSSAFGTKAGDFFTRLTIGIAAGWICLAMLLVILTNSLRESSWDSDSGTLTVERIQREGQGQRQVRARCLHPHRRRAAGPGAAGAREASAHQRRTVHRHFGRARGQYSGDPGTCHAQAERRSGNAGSGSHGPGGGSQEALRDNGTLCRGRL